jgi:O-antigen/teichoic acid export membrane protein
MLGPSAVREASAPPAELHFPWLKKGFWALSEHGLFALSNFALHILLARLLAPKDYGVFAVVFSVFILLSSIHVALVVEPMLVFGAGKYRDHKATYWRTLRSGHWAISACGSAILIIGGMALRPFMQSVLPSAMLMLGLVSPFMLLLALTRRACYVYLEPRLAAIGGAIYMALVLLGAWLLASRGWLNPVSALGVMGVGSLASAALLMLLLRQPGEGSEPGVRRSAIRDHWDYGRWAMGATTVGWIPANAFYLVLPLWGGLEATGAFRALTNLVLPLQHTYVAFGAILVPHLVRVRDTARWRPTLSTALLFLLAAAATCWVVLGVLNRQLVDLLYGGTYGSYAGLLWVVGLAPLAGAGVAVAGSALRALERPKLVFAANSASGAVALSVGLILALRWGVAGAAVALVLCALAACATMAFLLASSRDVGESAVRTPASFPRRPSFGRGVQ